MSRAKHVEPAPNEEPPTTRLLSLAWNRTASAIFERLREAGIRDIRPSHGNVMQHLTWEDGLRLNDLAEKAGMRPQSMGELVDQLEKLGYVERRPDSVDGRAKRIHLTAKGKRSTETAGTAVAAVNGALEQLLGQEQAKALRKALSTIADAPDL